MTKNNLVKKKKIKVMERSLVLTRDGVGEPTEDFDRKFDEIHGEVSQRSETEATWAQTTQYRPVQTYYIILSILV